MASNKSSEIAINGPTQVKGPSQVRSISKGNTPSATASDKSNEIAIEVRDHLRSKSNSIGKASSAAPLITSSEPKGVEKAGWKKGIAITDFLLRFCAIGASLAAATAMGTTDETLPFFTQFFQFQAQYDDFPEFMFFVIANAMVGGYLVLSLPFSIFRILRPLAAAPRLLLIVSDVVMMALTLAAAASAASIVYLAHNGNSSANWMAICNQFGDFCKSVSGAVVGSFIAAIILIFLVLLSAFALKGC